MVNMGCLQANDNLQSTQVFRKRKVKNIQSGPLNYHKLPTDLICIDC